MLRLRLVVPVVAPCVLAALMAVPRESLAQVGMDTPIVSMSLTPSNATLNVSGQQIFNASALLGTGATVQVGGGGSMLWRVSWGAAIDVSTCGTAATQFSSQPFQIDQAGLFHAVWSPSTPNTLQADGSMTLPLASAGASVTATLQCVTPGLTTGSFSAFWSGTQYDGTYTFGTGSGEVAVVGLTWTSSNPSVAAVDQAGRVTAIAPGDAVITATFGSQCWQMSPGTGNPCRGTTTATADVHVNEDDGGGGGEEGCAIVTFVLLPGSEPATQVALTLVDPSTGTEVGSTTVPLDQPISVQPGSYHLIFGAPPGQMVTSTQRGLNLSCGDDKIVRLRFHKVR